MHSIDDKLDKIVEKIGNIDNTLVRQEVQLAEHIRRTNLLEEKMVPVEKHVSMVHGAMKLITVVAAAAAILALLK